MNKQEIALSFSRAAPTYDAVATLQRQVGDQLLTMIPVGEYPSVLDLGCGTGYFSKSLAQLHAGNSDIQYFGLDIAPGMVAFANRSAKGGRRHWCCGDAESLPLAENSIELIFSNLALQWCVAIEQALVEARRVLKPGGRVAFSTLGPETLYELRSAWQQVDQYVHVNEFTAKSEVCAAAECAGFQYEVREERVVMGYQSLRDLTHELKSLGAHNLNSGRPLGLTGKSRIHQLLDAYELYRNQQGLLPATYQVYYFILRNEY